MKKFLLLCAPTTSRNLPTTFASGGSMGMTSSVTVPGPQPISRHVPRILLISSANSSMTSAASRLCISWPCTYSSTRFIFEDLGSCCSRAISRKVTLVWRELASQHCSFITSALVRLPPLCSMGVFSFRDVRGWGYRLKGYAETNTFWYSCASLRDGDSGIMM